MPPRKLPHPAVSQRLPQMDSRAMTILSPTSRGNGLNGPMRLVALLLLLWDEEQGPRRVEWDHDQIADRTGLTTAQVADALDKLRQVRMVQETAAGPRISWTQFKRTMTEWRDAHMLRPKPPVGSHHQPTTTERA